MAAKYRKVDPRTWKDEAFRALSIEEKLIALYIITAQSNRIGLFYFSPAMACEDLGMADVPDTYAIRFLAVCKAFSWQWDEAAKVIFIPTWFKYNQPENDKHMIGMLADLEDVPKTDLQKRFVENTQYIEEERLETFTSTLPRYLRRMPYVSDSYGISGAGAEKPAPPTGLKRPQISIPDQLNTPAFLTAWEEWQRHRSEIKKPLKPTMTKKQLAFLALAGEASAVEMIENSIRNGWLGLFPPTSAGNGKKARMSEDEEQRLIEETRKLMGANR